MHHQLPWIMTGTLAAVSAYSGEKVDSGIDASVIWWVVFLIVVFILLIIGLSMLVVFCVCLRRWRANARPPLTFQTVRPGIVIPTPRRQ